MILWYSRRIIIMRTTDYAEQVSKNRVALSSPIIRAYISLCWNCQNCIYDCRGVSSRLRRMDANHIRGPCAYAVFFLKLTKPEMRIDMSKIESSAGKALYEQQETKLSQQSAAFIELLTKRGILGDSSIDDDRVRQAKKEKKKSMYHNTLLLLQHYRTILWTLECFPSSVAEELDRPLKDLDTLLDRIDLELGMNNRKLEGRMESVRRSRLLVDRLNDAVSILKSKPVNGHKMYDIIYMTFLGPDKLMHEELLYRLDISARHYYRLRTQAINIIALRLWSAPAGEVDSWLEVLSILENW